MSHRLKVLATRTTFGAFVVILVLSVSSVGSARTGEDKLTYLAVAWGRVFPSALDPESKSTAPDPFANTSLSDVDLDNGDFLGLRVGRIFPHSQNAFLELEGFVIKGTDIDNEFFYLHYTGSKANLDADISVKALMVNLIVKKASGQIHPYVGFGTGWVWFDMRDIKLIYEPGWVSPEVQPKDDMSDSCFGVQGLLGVEFDITDTWALGLGYRYFYAEPDFEDGDDLRLLTTYKTNVITLGLSFRF